MNCLFFESFVDGVLLAELLTLPFLLLGGYRIDMELLSPRNCTRCVNVFLSK